MALDRGGINPHDLVYPESSTIRFDFPARGPNLPACEVTWYDGLDNEPTLAASYTKDGKNELLKSPGKELYSKDLVFKGGHTTGNHSKLYRGLNSLIYAHRCLDSHRRILVIIQISCSHVRERKVPALLSASVDR